MPFFEILLKWGKFEVKPPFQQQANLKLSFISGHFRSFYLSKLFMVGKSSATNSSIFICLQIPSFAWFPDIHTASYHIRKKAKLLSNCCRRSDFVVSAHAENLFKRCPILISFQMIPASCDPLPLRRYPSWFQCFDGPWLIGSLSNSFRFHRALYRKYVSNDDRKSLEE